MKKILLFILFLLTPFIVFAYPKGDVNGDNKVDIMDYQKIRNHIVGTINKTNDKTKLLTGDALKRADVNAKNGVDNGDYVDVRKIILNNLNSKSTETPTPTNTPQPTNTPKQTATVTPNPTNTPKQKATATPNPQNDIIHFIRTDKGRYGNTIVIESQGEFAIFDASGLDNQGVVTDAYLAKIGINKNTPIKYAIVSHFHQDHADYMDDIILKYNVQNVIYKDYTRECDSSSHQGIYTRFLNAVKEKKVNRVSLGKKDGSKKIKVGNFTLSFYNVNDQLCYGKNKGKMSSNVDSLGIVLTIKKGDKDMLTYLAGDMQNGKYNNEQVIADKIAKDYNNKTFDVYQAAHHGVNRGIENSKFKFKYPIITHSIGSLCNRDYRKSTENGVTTAKSIPVIYSHMKNNNKMYFSSARSVQVSYTSNGVTITGGEILECDNTNCSNAKKAWKYLSKKSVQKDSNGICKAYVLED